MALALAMAIELLQAAPDRPRPPAARPRLQAACACATFRSTTACFINDAYLIKGVAGAIFWSAARHAHRPLRLQQRDCA